jgi:hypothetical protein
MEGWMFIQPSMRTSFPNFSPGRQSIRSAHRFAAIFHRRVFNQDNAAISLDGIMR